MKLNRRAPEVFLGKSSHALRAPPWTSATGSEPDAWDRDDKATVPAHGGISPLKASSMCQTLQYHVSGAGVEGVRASYHHPSFRAQASPPDASAPPPKFSQHKPQSVILSLPGGAVSFPVSRQAHIIPHACPGRLAGITVPPAFLEEAAITPRFADEGPEAEPSQGHPCSPSP